MGEESVHIFFHTDSKIGNEIEFLGKIQWLNIINVLKKIFHPKQASPELSLQIFFLELISTPKADFFSQLSLPIGYGRCGIMSTLITII